MQPEFFPSKRYLRPDEVAQTLALSRRTVYRMIKDGRLPSFKLGATGALRIPRESLESLLTSL